MSERPSPKSACVCIYKFCNLFVISSAHRIIQLNHDSLRGVTSYLPKNKKQLQRIIFTSESTIELKEYRKHNLINPINIRIEIEIVIKKILFF